MSENRVDEKERLLQRNDGDDDDDDALARIRKEGGWRFMKIPKPQTLSGFALHEI